MRENYDQNDDHNSFNKKQVVYFDFFRSISVYFFLFALMRPVWREQEGTNGFNLALSVLQTSLYSSSKQYSHQPHTAL